jgi:hypothetical protein
MENNNIIFRNLKSQSPKNEKDDNDDNNDPFFWISLSMIFFGLVLFIFYYKNKKI